MENKRKSVDEVDFSRAKKIMVACQLRQKDLAGLLDVPLDRVKSLTSGRVKSFSLDEVDRLVEKLHLTRRWLMTGMGDMFSEDRGPADAPPDTRLTVPTGEFAYVPRYNVLASAGPGLFSDQEHVVDHMAFSRDWLGREITAPLNKLVIVTARGDSMEPTIRNGATVLVDTSVEDLQADAIYVIVVDGGVFIKRLQRLFGRGILIKSDNPVYDDQTLGTDKVEDLRIAGRVLWVGNKV